MQEKVHNGSASSEKRCTIGNPHLEAFGAPLRTIWGRLEDILGTFGGHLGVDWGCEQYILKNNKKWLPQFRFWGPGPPEKTAKTSPKGVWKG